MRFFIQIITILIVSLLLQIFLPWWTMAIGSFIVGYVFAETGFKSFLAGLLGVGLLWFAMSLYIDVTTHSILTEKVARLLPVKTVPLLILVTSLIGGLVGGLASMTGSLFTQRKRT